MKGPEDMVLFGGMNYSMDTLEMKELAMATGSRPLLHRTST